MKLIKRILFAMAANELISSCQAFFRNGNNAKEENQHQSGISAQTPIETRDVDYFFDLSSTKNANPIINDRVVVKNKDMSFVKLHGTTILIIFSVLMLSIFLVFLSLECQSIYDKELDQHNLSMSLEQMESERVRAELDSILNESVLTISSKLDTITKRIETKKINIKILPPNN